MSDLVSRVHAIIARACSPWERMRCAAFAPVDRQDAAVLESRRSAWIQRVAKGDEAAFARLLAARGIAVADWEASLRDVAVAQPDALPRWATVLLHLFETFAEPGIEVPLADRGPLAAFRVAGRRHLVATLDMHAQATCAIPVQALDGLLDWLVKRLLTAAAPSLRAEARLQAALRGVQGTPEDVFHLSGSREAWLGRFERQAGLAAALATVLSDWTIAMDELIVRLVADYRDIVATLFCERDPGPLQAIEYGTGDPHRGGRSVAILTFADGRLVYKPKDLRAAAALGRLIRELADDSAPDLACPPLLPRDGYAWEGFVVAGPCYSEAEADRFYARLGAWARLFQLLGAIDFWFDNLIAAGERPIFVDFETIMHPPAKHGHASGEPFGMAGLRQRLDDSPLWSGILPWLVPTTPGRDPSDLGCLARPGKHRTPMRAVVDGPGSSGSASEDGLITWAEERFAPFIVDAAGRRWADANEHMPAFRSGYAAMHHRLERADGRQALDRFLIATSNAPLRHILIDTWSCYRLIDLGTVPRVLSDGIRREIALEGYWATYPHVPTALGDGILSDLRRLDVPLLEARPDSTALDTVSGNQAGDYFAASAVTVVRNRLDTLSAAMLQAGLDAIATSFSTRPDRPRRPVPACAAASGMGALDAARAIGRTILDAWVAAERDPQGLVGLSFMPVYGVRSLAPLGRDLLSGTSGLTIFLAELHAATGDLDVAACAHALAEDLCAAPWHGDWSTEGYGAALGLGARLRALLVAERRLGRLDLLERARPWLRDLDASLAPGPLMLDWWTGIAGLLTVLRKVHAAHPSWGVDASAASAVRMVRDRGDRRVSLPAPISWDAGLHRLPSARCGWEMAARCWPGLVTPDLLGELSAVIPGPSQADSVGDLRGALSGYPAGSVLPGDLAARVVCRVREPMEAQPDSDRAAGRLDRLQLALSGMSHLPVLRGDAERLAGRITADYAATDSWFADDWAEDIHRLSAVDGIAAIGRAMLRLV